MNKFNAKKVTIDGHMFDSQREGARYVTLKRLQEQGVISGLELQPVFVLAPGVLVPGEKRKRPALRYFGDFRYQSNGRTVVEDVKSDATRALPAYRMKKHLLALLGVYVAEVK